LLAAGRWGPGPGQARGGSGGGSGREDRGGGLIRRLARQHVVVMVWLVVSAALVVTVLTVAQGGPSGTGGCVSRFVLSCDRLPPAGRPRPAAAQVARTAAPSVPIDWRIPPSAGPKALAP
jgi:hypothetical protein